MRYRGTSLRRNSAPLGPYSETMPRALWCSYGGGGLYGNNLKRFHDFCLDSKAIIWPSPSYMCRIRLPAETDPDFVKSCGCQLFSSIPVGSTDRFHPEKVYLKDCLDMREDRLVRPTEDGISQKGLRTFACTTRPESGLHCVCHVRTSRTVSTCERTDWLSVLNSLAV